MFRHRFLLQLLGKGTRVTLEEAIERHISSTGTGFELDDVMSNGRFPKQVTDRLFEISSRYRTPEHPTGVTNPASFNDLRLLAAQFGSGATR